MKTYRSVSGKGERELIIRKSRFISSVFPVNSIGAAEKYLEQVREARKDATHNVFAWQIGINKSMQRSSDDGEPSGTAGRPVLEVIRQQDLVNVLVIVTRYFGGIKLGAGGLIRAYSRAAREGLAAAGIVEKALHSRHRITVGYSHLGPVRSFLEKNTKIPEVTYLDQVIFTILALDDEMEEIKDKLKDITGGQLVVEDLGKEFCEI